MHLILCLLFVPISFQTFQYFPCNLSQGNINWRGLEFYQCAVEVDAERLRLLESLLFRGTVRVIMATAFLLRYISQSHSYVSFSVLYHPALHRYTNPQNSSSAADYNDRIYIKVANPL